MYLANKLANQNDTEARRGEQKMHATSKPNKTATSTKSALKFCKALEELIAVEPLGTMPSHGPMVPTSDSPCVRSIDGKNK